MKMSKTKEVHVVVTTDRNKKGVFAGYISEAEYEKFAKSEEKLESVQIRLKNAQMCVRWSEEVRGVIGLAATGPDKGCRITLAAPEQVISGVELIAKTSKTAEKAWARAPWSK